MNAYTLVFGLLASTVAVLAIAAPAPALTGCPDSGKSVRSIPKEAARTAIQCLFNNKRSARNLSRNGDLESAAQRHSGTMASQRCVSHQCSGEPDLLKRVSRTGYLRGSSNWGLGEVIIAGGARGTPRQIVKAWMNSPGHRDNIKRPSHEHVGIGLSIRDGSVYVAADFGHR